MVPAENANTLKFAPRQGYSHHNSGQGTLTGKPESDILYIGRTKKPGKRILGGYLAGYGGKNTKKINQMLLDEAIWKRLL